MMVVLMKGVERVQEIALDINFPVCQASIVDPFVSLLTENGELLIIQAAPTSQITDRIQLILTKPSIQQVLLSDICAKENCSAEDCWVTKITNFSSREGTCPFLLFKFDTPIHERVSVRRNFIND